MIAKYKILTLFKSVSATKCAISLNPVSQMRIVIVFTAQSCWEGAIHTI